MGPPYIVIVLLLVVLLKPHPDDGEDRAAERHTSEWSFFIMEKTLGIYSFFLLSIVELAS